MTTLSRTFVLHGESQAKALWATLRANWRQLAKEGKPLTVTVAQFKQKRSPDQNKRYWSLLGEIAEQAWVAGRQYSSEAWAEHFKREFIGLIEMPNGQSVGISTTSLDVSEFAIYMTRIEQYAAAELGVLFTQ